VRCRCVAYGGPDAAAHRRHRDCRCQRSRVAAVGYAVGFKDDGPQEATTTVRRTACDVVVTAGGVGRIVEAGAATSMAAPGVRAGTGTSAGAAAPGAAARHRLARSSPRPVVFVDQVLVGAGPTSSWPASPSSSSPMGAAPPWAWTWLGTSCLPRNSMPRSSAATAPARSTSPLGLLKVDAPRKRHGRRPSRGGSMTVRTAVVTAR